MKKYGMPLLVIILGSIIIHFVRTYLFFSNKQMMMTVLYTIVLFVFGCYLSGNTKRNKGWVKKFLITALTICLLFMQLGFFKVALIQKFLNIINANSLIFYMLYIYLGFLFF